MIWGKYSFCITEKTAVGANLMFSIVIFFLSTSDLLLFFPVLLLFVLYYIEFSLYEHFLFSCSPKFIALNNGWQSDNIYYIFEGNFYSAPFTSQIQLFVFYLYVWYDLVTVFTYSGNTFLTDYVFGETFFYHFIAWWPIWNLVDALLCQRLVHDDCE
jgi:hypothetical protein